MDPQMDTFELEKVQFIIPSSLNGNPNTELVKADRSFAAPCTYILVEITSREYKRLDHKQATYVFSMYTIFVIRRD